MAITEENILLGIKVKPVFGESKVFKGQNGFGGAVYPVRFLLVRLVQEILRISF